MNRYRLHGVIKTGVVKVTKRQFKQALEADPFLYCFIDEKDLPRHLRKTFRDHDEQQELEWMKLQVDIARTNHPVGLRH